MAMIRHIAERRGTALYEPVFDLETNWVVGVEALAPPPKDVRRTEAVQAAVAALTSLPSRTFVSVRLAPRELGRLLLILDGHRLDRVVAHLVTNGDGNGSAEGNGYADSVAGFRERGGRLALDVGGGRDVLGRVSALEPDLIELSAATCRGIDADRGRRALVIGLVALGQEIGSPVEAQGIATAGELAALRGLGVAYGRGPFLAEPFPLAELFPDLLPPDAA